MYPAEVIQNAAQFSQSLLESVPSNSTIVYIGGGCTEPDLSAAALQQKNVSILNIDFDRLAFTPRVLIDINTVPDDFFLSQGTLVERIESMRGRISRRLHMQLDALLESLTERPARTAVLSHVCPYLSQNKRKKLFRLFADPAVSADIIVAESTIGEYESYDWTLAGKRGDLELQEILEERHDLTLERKFLVPIIPADAPRILLECKEAIARSILEGQATVEEHPYVEDREFDEEHQELDGKRIAWKFAEVIMKLRRK